MKLLKAVGHRGRGEGIFTPRDLCLNVGQVLTIGSGTLDGHHVGGFCRVYSVVKHMFSGSRKALLRKRVNNASKCSTIPVASVCRTTTQFLGFVDYTDWICACAIGRCSSDCQCAT